jgi:hypothetical protein
LIRVELAKQRDEENERIYMEAKTKDMRLFQKLVRNNRKKGNGVIMNLNVNGIQYEGEENVITGFREHLVCYYQKQVFHIFPGISNMFYC